MRREDDGSRRIATIGEVHFTGAIDGEGCSICRHVRTNEERWIWQVLYEFSSDRTLRSELNRSFGLCPPHARLLVAVVEERELVDGVSVAHIYESIVHTYLEGCQAANGSSRRAARSLEGLEGEDCPLCAYQRGVEERTVSVLLKSLESNAGVARYRSSDGLCNAHLRRCAQEAERPDVRRLLLDDHIERLERLAATLGELLRKQRYDVDEDVTPEEAASWREVIWRFAGMAYDRPLVRRRLR